MSAGVFQKVLVPVEFEPANEGDIAPDRMVEVGDHDWVAVGECTIRALELAARLASGGDVYIVHATPDFRDYATWMPPARIAELDGGASHHAKVVLEVVARQHCRGVTLHYINEPGKALDVVLEAAREHSPDAIVLAASARHRVNRAFLGSTADKVIRQSPCPVVVVPSGTA
ncbi:universal stress protein [Paraliomyxa miuraensis]|uniref:universal stress protein n=1 Tax=Paraliomyxa miuraensis TaxID=376150 RepID=UPI00225369D6|nr:universal stress protein [Paraliomyxa miuraensis]MCX4247113.1 universal stress protein [Paraliomyxa miuraensis]